MDRPEKKARARATPSWLFQVAYELGLLLAALTFLLAPVHAAFTLHVNLDGRPGPDLATMPAPTAANLRAGDRLPIYRYFEGAKSEIGSVRVESVADGHAFVKYLDAREPIARQGRIESLSASGVVINLGGQVGIQPGDELVVFDGRRQSGRVRVDEVEPLLSRATVQSGSPKVGDTVSEFTVATQAVVFANPWISALEWTLFGLALGLYGLGWMRWRKSPFEELGTRLRSRTRAQMPVWLSTGLRLVLGAPLVWISCRFVGEGALFVAARIAILVSPTDWRPTVESLGAMVDAGMPWMYVLGGLLYVALLIRFGRSPFLMLWEALRFRGGPLRWSPTQNGYWLGIGGACALIVIGVMRDPLVAVLGVILLGALLASRWSKALCLWLLQLTIAYAFASTLFTFMAADMNAALATAWPNSGIQVSGSLNLLDPGRILDFLTTSLRAAGFMLTHAPNVGNVEGTYITARYLLWTLTIAGCLVGYGHSILGPLWGKRLRNLDYTPTGWITNAVCYGPLLGVVIWQMVPPLRGADPTVVSGPLFSIDLVVELFLDVVYMLTIWNLGVMFGVMTDKGVRTSGFYAVVRHPSYTAEALMFVAMELKGLTTGQQWIAVAMYFFTYWLRSEREDHFMGESNPDYEPYRKSTPFKFIPGIY